jgi:hypothetical protein
MEIKELKTVTGNLKSTEEKEVEYSETKNKITRRLTVREVENGFIIEVYESGYKASGKGEDWYSARQTYISNTNPLEEKEECKDCKPGKKCSKCSEEKSEGKEVEGASTVKEKIALTLKNLNF